MNIHEFLTSPADSARREGPHNKIVLSSRVRLARNLKGLAFPGWAKKVERIKLLELTRPAAEALRRLAGAFSESMANLSVWDRNIFVSGTRISGEHAPRTAATGLA